MIRESDISTLLLGSVIGGFFTGIVTNTLEVMKTLVMNEALTGSSYRKENISGFKHYYNVVSGHVKSHGWQSLFRGCQYNTGVSIVRASILFPMYEYSKDYSS